MDLSRELVEQELAEQLQDEKFKTRLAEIANSRVWKRVMEFLLARREQIYALEPKDTPALWKKEGQLQELQLLLRLGPTLVLQYETWKARSAASKPDPRPDDAAAAAEDGLS